MQVNRVQATVIQMKSSEEENVSPKHVDINRTEPKDWCIFERCKKERREINQD